MTIPTTPPTPVNPEAQFWQMKYFELLQHTSQVMAALARPTLRAPLQAQADKVRDLLKDAETAAKAPK